MLYSKSFFILYIGICIFYSPSLNLSLPPFPLGDHNFVFYVYESVLIL